jgi:hypothetical protein
VGRRHELARQPGLGLTPRQEKPAHPRGDITQADALKDAFLTLGVTKDAFLTLGVTKDAFSALGRNRPTWRTLMVTALATPESNGQDDHAGRALPPLDVRHRSKVCRHIADPKGNP